MKKLFVILIVFLSTICFARDIQRELDKDYSMYIKITSDYQVDENIKMKFIFNWFKERSEGSNISVEYSDALNTITFCRTYMNVHTGAQVHIFMTYKALEKEEILISNDKVKISVWYIWGNEKKKLKDKEALGSLLNVISETDSDVDLE